MKADIFSTENSYNSQLSSLKKQYLTYPLSFLSESSELQEKLIDCFWNIKKSLLIESSENNEAYEAVIDWDEKQIITRGKKHRVPGVSFHNDLCGFSTQNNSEFASREKIHIHPGAFTWLSQILYPDQLTFLKDLFFNLANDMNSYEKEHFDIKSDDYSYQLLLIRYSQEAKKSKSDLHRLGSAYFGCVHEDETLYSFHLGETLPELLVFDYGQHEWIKPRFIEKQALVLLGQEARKYNLLPTPHRLVANTNESQSERFSFIIERTPVTEKNRIHQNEHSEFIRFNSPEVREKHTAFLFWDELPDGTTTSSELLDLTEDLVRLHMYFLIKNDKRKLVRFQKSSSSFAQLESLGFKYVACIRPGFLTKCEKSVEELLLLAQKYPEKYFIHHYHKNLRSGLSLALLGQGRGVAIDRHIEEYGINKTLSILPHDQLDEFPNSFFSHQLDLNNHPKNEWGSLIKQQRSEIENHLNEGFSSTFVFNTEGYKDVEELVPPDSPLHVIGFASGFKINYISHLFKNNVSQITYLDSNVNSLKLKKDMISSWNGLDFPSWFASYWKNQFRIYEKSPQFLQNCWRREVAAWGDAEIFLSHWQWFCQQDVSFCALDVINDTDQLAKLFNPNKVVILWASNLWHNEFVSYRYGEENVGNTYLKWLLKLDKHHPNIFLIQDDVPHDGGWISPNGKTARSLLKDYGLI